MGQWNRHHLVEELKGWQQRQEEAQKVSTACIIGRKKILELALAKNKDE